MTVYPGTRGRLRAVQYGAADAKTLLQSKLPFVLRLLTAEQVGQVQKVVDAAVVNPVVQQEYAEAARKNGDAQRARGYYSDGAVSRAPDSPQMRKLADELIDATAADKHIRLEPPKLLSYDALKPLTDNPDEATYLNKVTRTLGSAGVYLRIEPKLVHDPDDRSSWIVSQREFEVWLSLGFDGDTIPTKDGQLTRVNLLETTTLGAGYYTEVIQGTFQSRFDQAADRVSRQIRNGIDLHEDQEGARDTAAPGVVAISDYLGDADYPSEKMWDQPWKLLMEARDLNKDGNIVDAGKRLSQAAMLADLAGLRLNAYIDATVKGASRAVFAAKVVVVVTSALEAAFNVYALAVTASELAAGEAALEVAKNAGQRTARRAVRKEIDRAAFDRMLATGKSTFRRSALTEDLRGFYTADVQRIWDAAAKRGIELTDKELDTLFDAAQAKWYAR